MIDIGQLVMISQFILVLLFGLAVGSFLGAFTYRFSRNIKVSSGRSICPKCKKKIAWHDNIPLISYVFLGGKCRMCSKEISLRYPIIELSTGVIFSLIVYFNFIDRFSNVGFINELSKTVDFLVLPYLLFMAILLIAIFIIDYEHKIIPDELTYLGILSTVVLLLLSSNGNFFVFLLSGFTASLFLLLIHLLTKGKGMGLGDVKFAILFGMFLGWPLTLVWLFLSFVIGAGVGIVLILLGRAKLGKQIPFGPFLVVSFFITLIWGSSFIGTLYLF